MPYCTFIGIEPKDFDNKIGKTFKDVRVSCPKINALRRKYSEKNDFNTVTLLEIEDISNLIKGLLKINIDISHNEYYLKIDIPNDSSWWYGYTEGHDDFIVCADTSDNIVCGVSPNESNIVHAYLDNMPKGEVVCKDINGGDSVVCDRNFFGDVVCCSAHSNISENEVIYENRGFENDIICGRSDTSDEVICHSSTESDDVICGRSFTDSIVCRRTLSGQVVCGKVSYRKWISFEPTIEYKFSNLHAAN